MHKFFVETKHIEENKIYIYDEDYAHIKKVLRLKEKDKIEVSDGEKSEYLCEIASLQNEYLELNILTKNDLKTESQVSISIYQGLPKSEKMDYIVQKNTEIGVKEIVPVVTDRTIIKIKDMKKEEKKLSRWRKIARESAKQSKRGIIPTVSNIVSLKDALEKAKETEIIVFYEMEHNNTLKTLLREPIKNKISIFIGPEGGFEKDEIELIKEYGGKVISLGKRILRTETAGLVASAIILYELDNTGEELQ